MDQGKDSDAIQQALLDKLMQYGDSLLDTEDYEKRKEQALHKAKNNKRKHKEPTESQDHINSPVSSEESAVGKRKKKKKALKNGHGNLSEGLTLEEGGQKKRKGRTLREFEEELRVYKETKESELVVESQSDDDVEENMPSGPEVIIFDDPAKRKKSKTAAASKAAVNNIDLKSARLEVQKFGLSGFAYGDRKKFEQDKAIRLGAKPPKKDYVNYKLYMEQVKAAKTEAMRQKEITSKLGLKIASSSDSGEKDIQRTLLRNHGFWKDRSTEKGFHLDGQVGRYRDGVLMLKRKDITKVNGKFKKTNNNNSGGGGKSGMPSGRVTMKGGRAGGNKNAKGKGKGGGGKGKSFKKK